MDGTRADHNQQAVILARHDAVDALAGVCNQLSTGCHGWKEADQVLRRRQHGDVLDAFVVGLTGAIGLGAALRLPGFQD